MSNYIKENEVFELKWKKIFYEKSSFYDYETWKELYNPWIGYISAQWLLYDPTNDIYIINMGCHENYSWSFECQFYLLEKYENWKLESFQAYYDPMSYWYYDSYSLPQYFIFTSSATVEPSDTNNYPTLTWPWKWEMKYVKDFQKNQDPAPSPSPKPNPSPSPSPSPNPTTSTWNIKDTSLGYSEILYLNPDWTYYLNNKNFIDTVMVFWILVFFIFTFISLSIKTFNLWRK